MSIHTTGHGRVAILAIVAGFVLLSSEARAAAEELDDLPPLVPQLSMTITDGRERTDVDDRLEYTIVIHNVGVTDALALLITQSVPKGMTFGAADGAGTLDAETVRWTVDLAAAETISLNTTMDVDDALGDLLRLATVACAHSTVKEAPIVCASDSNLLPAGEAVSAAAAPDLSRSSADTTLLWIFGGTALIAGLFASGLALLGRRRRHAVLAGDASGGYGLGDERDTW